MAYREKQREGKSERRLDEEASPSMRKDEKKKRKEGLGHVWKDVREEKEQDIDGRETREDFERV